MNLFEDTNPREIEITSLLDAVGASPAVVGGARQRQL